MCRQAHPKPACQVSGLGKLVCCFERNFGAKALECLGALVWNNFWKLRQLKLDRYVFVNVFQRFVFITLLINVMSHNFLPIVAGQESKNENSWHRRNLLKPNLAYHGEWED
jgi:hypothetical protein